MSVSVLFICLGNICRSPSAQGSLEKLVADAKLSKHIRVDSAGTAAFNTGKSPDSRAIEAANRCGLNIDQQIARQITDEDYQSFDYIIAMDRINLSSIQAWAPKDYHGEIELLLQYSPNATQKQIADPYYEDANRFDKVLQQLEQANQQFLKYLITRHQFEAPL